MILIKEIIRFSQKPALRRNWILLILVFAFIPQIFLSFQIVQGSGQSDFYSRFIGTRLLIENQSPYFFNGFSNAETNASNPVNGVTATPFALWMQIPLARLPYCKAKTAWWIIEEGLLFFTMFFTCLYPRLLGRQILTIAVALVFFCYSRNWWVHIYSGQYYVVFAFIFSVTVYYGRRKTLPLLLFPLTALLRPFFVLAGLPYLFNDFIFRLKWFVGGIALALVILVFSGTHKLLPEYNKAMKVYSSEITGWKNGYDKKLQTEPFVSNMCGEQKYDFEDFNAGCLFSVQHYLKLLGLSVGSPIFFGLLLLVFIGLFLLTNYTRIVASSENVIIASFLIYIFCELFTPANRNPYNLVEYLGIIGLLMQKAGYTAIIVIILGLALNLGFPVAFLYQKEMGEIILLLGIYLSLYNKQEVASLA